MSQLPASLLSTPWPSDWVPTWHLSIRLKLTLEKPRVMGIVNLTPDSFFDGGKYTDVASAVDAANQMVRDGAEIIDVGGESTRPGAARVDAGEQIRRVTSFITAFRAASPQTGISIDTTLPEVARAALDAGADCINDISAGREGDIVEGKDAMLRVAGKAGAGIILMHRLRSPEHDSYSDRYGNAPEYEDVAGAVKQELTERAIAALGAGVGKGSIVIDPGLGFGKSVEQNLELIQRTPVLLDLGFPVLSAASRKSFVGRVSLRRDSHPSERLHGSIAMSLVHLLRGARIFRVHDVAEQVIALRGGYAILEGSRAACLPIDGKLPPESAAGRAQP